MEPITEELTCNTNVTLGRVLGKGAFGKVNVATTDEGELVVAKTINVTGFSTRKREHISTLLAREVDTMRRLNELGSCEDEDVVCFRGYCKKRVDDKDIFIIYMKYVEGHRSLSVCQDIISSIDDDRIRNVVYLYICLRIMMITMKINAWGIYHRDIKPDNFVADMNILQQIQVMSPHIYDDDLLRMLSEIKLMALDFGVSCSIDEMDDNEVAYWDNMLGRMKTSKNREALLHPCFTETTMEISAPEWFYAKSSIDEGVTGYYTDDNIRRFDEWSASVTMYYLITGEYLFGRSQMKHLSLIKRFNEMKGLEERVNEIYSEYLAMKRDGMTSDDKKMMHKRYDVMFENYRLKDLANFPREIIDDHRANGFSDLQIKEYYRKEFAKLRFDKKRSRLRGYFNRRGRLLFLTRHISDIVGDADDVYQFVEEYDEIPFANIETEHTKFGGMTLFNLFNAFDKNIDVSWIAPPPFDFIRDLLAVNPGYRVPFSEMVVHVENLIESLM